MKQNTIILPACVKKLAVFLSLLTAGFVLRAADPVLPAQVDLRPQFAAWNMPIKKQGARNTCSVFTTVGGMEFALARKLNRGVSLSEEYLNWACNQVIGNATQDRGQFFSDLLKGYEQHGICTESEMPYAKTFSPRYRPSGRAFQNAQQIRKIGLRANWIKSNDGKVGIADTHINQMKETLHKGWPVCAGSAHSVLVVGYQDNPSLPGGGQFLLRDSGDGNEQTMTYQAAKARLCDLLWYDSPPLVVLGQRRSP